MKKKVESFPALTQTVAEESNIIDTDYTVVRDPEKAIKEFKESLVDFMVSLTADIKNLSKNGQYASDLKILSGDEKHYDRILKAIEKQEILIRVLRMDTPFEDEKKKTEQTRVSVETMAK